MPKYPSDYPLEYQTGSVVFFGRKFLVTPHVLIPRLETECLVKKAREILEIHPNTILVDIGTGSGIIGISVRDLAKQFIGIDISESALQVARQNDSLHPCDTPTIWIQGDLLSPLRQIFLDTDFSDTFLITANLPYIREDDWVHMSADTRYEPKNALFGGDTTGFEMYERLFEELQDIASIFRNTHIEVLIEFGYDQTVIAKERIEALGWKPILFSDYAGIERFAHIQIQ